MIPFFLTIPNMFVVTMTTTTNIGEDKRSCYTLYHLKIADHGLNSELVFSITMWLYSILLKLVPCLILTIFTDSLIRAMYQVAERMLSDF